MIVAIPGFKKMGETRLLVRELFEELLYGLFHGSAPYPLDMGAATVFQGDNLVNLAVPHFIARFEPR